MATLQLQAEVDSEVHPELYAVLSAIGNASLRPERLRQLAAGGLIWEHLRALPRLDAGAGAALAETARAADSSALSRALSRTRAALPPALAPAAEEPPVLQDVVEVVAAQSAPRPRTRAAPERRAGAVPVNPEPAAASPAPDDVPAAAKPLHETGAKRSGPRSRLLLMKERGLFKNG
jgi:hypothetical protein